MSTKGIDVDDLVGKIEACRAAQVYYFKIRKGDIVGLTQKEQAKALRECIRLETEIDQWIALYRAEQARWKWWEVAHYDEGSIEARAAAEAKQAARQPKIEQLFE